MSKPMDNFKTNFIERYQKSQESCRLIEESINLLESITTESNTDDVINSFMPTISNYNAHTEESTSVKEILQEVIDNKRPISVAIAFLNYLYDVSYYKASRLLFIQDIFKCYF